VARRSELSPSAIERHRERVKQYAKDNPEKYRAYRKASELKAKLTVMRFYSHLEGDPGCRCCETTYLPHLTIDHIDGHGADTRRRTGQGKGYALYRWLIANDLPSGYQVLCWNCNSAKAHLGECGCQSHHQEL
jgi:hypothetical protein